MKYRQLSSTGDYKFGFGNTCFLNGSEAVAQAIQTKLKLFKGDYWEDLNDGLPFFQSMAGSSDKSAIDLIIQSRVSEVPNVTGITSFSSSIDANRRYAATMTVSTAFGMTVEVSV
jgi:hypothetical protein